VHAADGLDQLVLGQRTGGGLDLVAVLTQPGGGVGVNVLQQQDPQRPVGRVQR
jgi:hypothetical protein